MKKFILSFTVTVMFVFYILYNRFSQQPLVSLKSINLPGNSTTTDPSVPVNNLTEKNIQPAPAKIPVTNQSPKQNPVPTQTTPTQPAPAQNNGLYKDGQYTGNSVDAFYGFVQVKAIISGGKISDVQFLNYPQDRRNSQEINSQAMPLLTQEAIVAQSARVDIVSGATDTSLAFIQSLASALTQAKN